MAAVGRRERKKQRMREHIISEARALFVEQGYDKTTVADVADRVDIAVSTLFGYFPSKLEILFAGYDEVVEAWVAAIATRPIDERAIDATLRLHADARVTRTAGPSDFDEKWFR